MCGEGVEMYKNTKDISRYTRKELKYIVKLTKHTSLLGKISDLWYEIDFRFRIVHFMGVLGIAEWKLVPVFLQHYYTSDRLMLASMLVFMLYGALFLLVATFCDTINKLHEVDVDQEVYTYFGENDVEIIYNKHTKDEELHKINIVYSEVAKLEALVYDIDSNRKYCGYVRVIMNNNKTRAVIPCKAQDVLKELEIRTNLKINYIYED